MRRLALRISKLEIFKQGAEKTEDYETVWPGEGQKALWKPENIQESLKYIVIDASIWPFSSLLCWFSVGQ